MVKKVFLLSISYVNIEPFSFGLKQCCQFNALNPCLYPNKADEKYCVFKKQPLSTITVSRPYRTESTLPIHQMPTFEAKISPPTTLKDFDWAV